MNFKSKLIFPVLISVISSLFVAGFVFAWTNPSSNPPSGGGALNFSGGNVGIGAAPGYKLDVQGGQINASGGLCINADCKTAWSQVGGGSITSAANVSSGQFGGNTGGGNYSFPANVSIGSGQAWNNWSVSNVNSPIYTGFGAQKINARASAYAAIAGRNPGSAFSVYMVPWDGTNTLEYNCNTQINAGWHPQAAIKGNYFNQGFDSSDFTQYSTVLLSQADFDTYKANGTQWWIACSTLSSFSQSFTSSQWTTNSGNIYYNSGNVGIGTTGPTLGKLEVDGVNTTLIAANVSSGYGGIDLDAAGVQKGFIGYAGSAGNYGAQTSAGDIAIGAKGVNLHFETGTGNSNTLMFLGANSGNVGIGTTGPGYKLDVAGDINTTGVFRVNGVPISSGGTTIPAANVSAGSFGANTGGGNYTFSGITTHANQLFLTGGWGQNGAPYYAALQIQGSYPSIEFRSNTSNSVWLYHMSANGYMNWYNDPGSVNGTNWSDMMTLSPGGVLTATQFNGSGAGLTGTAASLTVGNADTVDSLHAASFTRKDTTGQWIKPYYEYSGNYLTTEAPSTLASQMGSGGGLRVDFMHPSYTANGQWGQTLTWSGYNYYGMYQLAGGYGGATPSLAFRHEVNAGTNTWSAWRTICDSSNNCGGGTTSAANVSAGSFGANTGGGNYTFSGNVNISGAYPSGVLTVPSSYIYAQDVYSYSSSKWLSQTLSGNSGYGLLSGYLAGWSGATSLQATNGGGSIYVYTPALSPARYWVGINTTSPGYELDVNGTAHRSDNSYYWTVASDVRLKKNIQPLSNSLDLLNQLKPVTFNWRDSSKGTATEMGFIAQDVEGVFPQWVKTNSEGYKTLTPNGIDALLVSSVNSISGTIKDQQKQISDQQKQIEELKAEIDALKK